MWASEGKIAGVVFAYDVRRVANRHDSLKMPALVDMFNNSRHTGQGALLVQIAHCIFGGNEVITKFVKDGLLIVPSEAWDIVTVTLFLNVIKVKPVVHVVCASRGEVSPSMVGRKGDKGGRWRHRLRYAEEDQVIDLDL